MTMLTMDGQASGLTAPTLSGATAIGRALGVCDRTIRRWYEDGLLGDLVWKGPLKNSALKTKRENLPRLRELAGRSASR